jgi:hypothetical protein
MPKLPLTESDFYKGKKNPYEDVIKSTEILQKSLEDTAKQATKTAEALNVKIKANPKETAKDYKELSNNVTELGRTVQAVNKANEEAARLDVARRKLLTEQARINAKNTVALQEQRKALRDQAKESLGLVSAYDKLNKRLVTARKNAKNIAVQYGATSKEFKRAAKEVLILDARIKKIDKSLGLSQRQVGNYGMAFKKAGGSVAAFALSFIGIRQAFRIIGSSVGTIAKFEKAMDEVVAITGAANDEFKDLEKNALQLGATTSKTAIEVAGLQKEFAKLGFSTDEILDATEATIQLSIAAGADLSESAVVAASTVRAFGLDAAETQRVVDVMAKSFTSSALDIEKFKVAMATAAPVAKATGNNIEFTAAQLSVLADAGLDASTSGTSLRNIFLELSKRGLSFEEGLRKINSSTDKATTALDLFGKRGATAALVLADNTEKALELEDAYNDAAGAAKNMADIMEDNLIGDVKLLSSAWDGFILSLNSGEGDISRVLRTLTQGLTSAITKIQQLNTSAEDLGLSRAERRFKSSRDYILRQEKEFQQARLKEILDSEQDILDSVQAKLDKQGESIFYSKRTLKDLEARKVQSEETIRLLLGFQEELQKRVEEENKLTAKQISLILKYNEELNQNLELNIESFNIASEYYKSLKAQEDSIQGLKDKLQALKKERLELNRNDIQGIKVKEEEIEKVQDQIKILESLYDVLSKDPEPFKIDLEADIENLDTTEIYKELDKALLDNIKERHEIIQDLETEHYDSLLGIFNNYRNRQLAAKQELSNEELKLQIEQNERETAAIQNLADTLISIYNSILETRINQLTQSIETKNQQINELQTQIQTEQSLLEAGAANELETEKEKLRQLQEERDRDVREREKIQKKQEAINTLTQISELATAVATIINSAVAELGWVGVIAGLAAAAAAVVGFSTYKSEAQSAAYAEEGDTFVKKGTSIESGKRHKDGGNKYKSAEFEQGEAVSVFSRKATSKYYDEIVAFEQALNNDEWEMYKYSLASLKSNKVLVHNDYSDLLREQQTTNKILRSAKTPVMKNGNMHYYDYLGRLIKSN